jgi:large subunit ribosomal protein L9
MKVILRKNIKKLGLMGEIKTVKDGYGRNFLLPEKLAEIATPGAIKNWKLGEELRKKRLEKEVKQAEKIAVKMSKLTLSFSRKVVKEAEEVKMFGSVSKVDILKALKTKGFSVSKDDISLTQPIKKPGETTVSVTLYPNVKAKVTVKIVAQK